MRTTRPNAIQPPRQLVRRLRASVATIARPCVSIFRWAQFRPI
jgi:hypothetical protein